LNDFLKKLIVNHKKFLIIIIKLINKIFLIERLYAEVGKDYKIFMICLVKARTVGDGIDEKGDV
jgi:hypothetical protein